jgi:hypothetical protein
MTMSDVNLPDIHSKLYQFVQYQSRYCLGIAYTWYMHMCMYLYVLYVSMLLSIFDEEDTYENRKYNEYLQYGNN